MRTTVSINDHLLEQAKRRAGERGVTLGTFIEEALRHELASVQRNNGKVEIPVFLRGTGVHPGIDLMSNRSIQETLDDGLTLDRLR